MRIKSFPVRDEVELDHHGNQPIHLQKGLDACGLLNKCANPTLHTVEHAGFHRIEALAKDRAEHHWLHHALPSLPQCRNRPVVVKQCKLNLLARHWLNNFEVRFFEIARQPDFIGQSRMKEVVYFFCSRYQFGFTGSAGLVDLPHGDGRSQVGQTSRLNRVDPRGQTGRQRGCEGIARPHCIGRAKD